jgi:hypothetical protein
MVTVVCAFLVLSGCDKGPAEAEVPGQAEGSMPEGAVEGTPAGIEVAQGEPEIGSNYTLDHPAVSIVRGESGQLELHVSATSGFHINLEYPWRLILQANDGVQMESLEWDRSTMVTFTEDEAVYQIPVSTAADGIVGAQEVTGELRFSVCNDARCDTPRAQVAWAVNIE